MAPSTADVVSARTSRQQPNRTGQVEAAGRSLLSSDRLDVVVHFLALEELAGSAGAVGPLTRNTCWVNESEVLSALDDEPSVVELAADLLASLTLDRPVEFNHGGELVGGATVAAAALYSGRTVRRVILKGNAPDRSQRGLESFGWNDRQLQAVASTWLRLDSESAIVIVSHDHPGKDAALHELQCRYDQFYSCIDHLSLADAARLNVIDEGTVEVVGLKASGANFTDVLSTHADAAVAGGQARLARHIADVLFSPVRSHSTSRAHEAVLRRRRRRESVEWLIRQVRSPRRS